MDVHEKPYANTEKVLKSPNILWLFENFIDCSHYPCWNIIIMSVLSIGPGTRRSSSGYSVESRRVYLTFKNSPERNSPGLLILLRHVLFRGSHLLQILLKALLCAFGFAHCRYFPSIKGYSQHYKNMPLT